MNPKHARDPWRSLTHHLHQTLGPKVGEHLRALRESQGLSTYQAAARLGVSRVVYSRFEAGTHVPGLVTIIAAFQLLTTDASVASRAVETLVVDVMRAARDAKP